MHATLDELWRLTQTPSLHEKWDLRFSRIEYLPRDAAEAAQQFLYETRIGAGMSIRGTGESVGEFDHGGNRASALKFASDDPKSLILHGSGYWKYIPHDGGIRFLTQYDYRTRFGPLGGAVDALIFRPALGWATAWSFDRLRLWLERGLDPVAAAGRAVIDAFARVSLCFIWMYQGLVPKLLARDPREAELAREALPAFRDSADLLVTLAGIAEVVIALTMLVLWRKRGVYVVSAAAAVLVTLPALFATPGLLVEAFNPVTLVAGIVALSVVGFLACRDLPTATRCLRRKPGGD